MAKRTNPAQAAPEITQPAQTPETNSGVMPAVSNPVDVTPVDKAPEENTDVPSADINPAQAAPEIEDMGQINETPSDIIDGGKIDDVNVPEVMNLGILNITPKAAKKQFQTKGK